MILKNRIAVSILFGVSGFLFANFTSRLPQIKALYGLSNGEIGISLFLIAIGALVAMPITGYLLIKQRSKFIAFSSALSYCLLIGFVALMPGYAMLNVLLFFIGLLIGSLDVAMNGQAIEVEKASGRKIMTSFHAIYSAGMMIGAGVGVIAIKLGGNLTFHFISIGAMALAAVLWTKPNLSDENPVELQPGGGFKLPKASLLGIGFIAFCCMLGEGAIANWSTTYMLDITHVNASLAPLGLVAFSCAMMVARLIGDKMRTNFGDRKLLISSSILAGLGLSLVLLIPQPMISIIGFFLVGLGLAVIVPIVYSTAGHTPNIPPSVGIGMVTTIGYAGLLLGPPLIGFLAEWQNIQVAMIGTLILFVVMGMLSWRFKVGE